MLLLRVDNKCFSYTVKSNDVFNIQVLVPLFKVLFQYSTISVVLFHHLYTLLWGTRSIDL